MSSIVCPICAHDDQIQKLSAIASSGTATGSFSGPTGGVTYSNKQWGTFGGYSHLTGQTATKLAQMLEPPRKPTPSTFSMFPGTCLTVVVVLIGAAITTVTLIENSIPTALLFLVLTAAISAFLARGSENQRKAFEAEHLKENQLALDRYQIAVALYDRSYYCFRDDQVFDPETGKHCAPQNLAEFLFPPENRPENTALPIAAEPTKPIRGFDNTPERVSRLGAQVFICPKCGTMNSLVVFHCEKCGTGLERVQPISNPYV